METPGTHRLAQRLHDALATWSDVESVELAEDDDSAVYVLISYADGSFGEFFVSVEDA